MCHFDVVIDKTCVRINGVCKFKHKIPMLPYFEGLVKGKDNCVEYKPILLQVVFVSMLLPYLDYEKRTDCNS